MLVTCINNYLAEYEHLKIKIRIIYGFTLLHNTYYVYHTHKNIWCK